MKKKKDIAERNELRIEARETETSYEDEAPRFIVRVLPLHLLDPQGYEALARTHLPTEYEWTVVPGPDTVQ